MPQNQNPNIALTGLMGSGKSTIGKYLAQYLKKKFIDTDSLIEEREGKSIAAIFERDGEEYFRHLEKNLIEEIFAQKNDLVISLGGGAIVNAESRKLIKQNSTLITLIAQPKDLCKRIKRHKSRPLLQDTKKQLETLEKLWLERKEAYYDSHHQIDTTGKSINLISLDILKTLGLHKPRIQEQDVIISRPKFKYKIYFKELSRLNLDSLNPGKKILVVSQKPVAKHFLEIVTEKLCKDYQVSTMIIDDNEEAKNFLTYQLILQKLLSLNFERQDTLLALGGGVVGDIVGFAASTYYRGINYVQVPTTLLSMIDSSVGGKTGINVPEGKNLIGSFYQPHMVHIDVTNLQTLPEKEFKSGLGELVKYIMLGSNWDEELGDNFYHFIQAHVDEILEKDETILTETVSHCLRIKAGIVAKDETEKGLRANLNLGHTFGHALEEITQYKAFTHGEAVAIGIVCACYLAEELDMFKNNQTEKIKELLNLFQINYKIPKTIKTEDIIQAFKYDKKNVNGLPRFVLPKANIGKVETVKNADIEAVIRAIERNR